MSKTVHGVFFNTTGTIITDDLDVTDDATVGGTLKVDILENFTPGGNLNINIDDDLIFNINDDSTWVMDRFNINAPGGMVFSAGQTIHVNGLTSPGSGALGLTLSSHPFNPNIMVNPLSPFKLDSFEENTAAVGVSCESVFKVDVIEENTGSAGVQINDDLDITGNILSVGNTFTNNILNSNQLNQVAASGDFFINVNDDLVVTATIVTNELSANTSSDLFLTTRTGANSIVCSRTLKMDATISATTNNDLTLEGDGTGVVVINDALKLPTSGGTAVELNYAEDTEDTTISWSGPWAVDQTRNFRVTRIQNMVFLGIDAVSSTASVATIAQNTVAIPSRFRPTGSADAGSVYFSVPVIDNGGFVQGALHISTGGIITIGVGAASGNYSGAGASGFGDLSVSYHTT